MKRKDNKYHYINRGDAIVHTLGSAATIQKDVKALRNAFKIMKYASYGGTKEHHANIQRVNRLANKLEKLAQEVQ